MNIKRKGLALLTALTLALSSAAPFTVFAAGEETAPEITVIEAAAPEPEEITEAEEPEESPEEISTAAELFAADGDTEQSSEHVASVELSDGTTYYYTTLAAAVTYANGAAASAGAVTTTVTLLSDVTLTDKVTLTNTSNVLKSYLVLDLNGKTITGNVTDDYAFYLGASNNNGYITVKNGAINAGDSAYGAIQIDGEYVQLDTLTLTSKTAGHGTVLVNAVRGNSTAPSTFTDLTINTVDGACIETAAGTVANSLYLYMDGTNTFTQTMSNGTQASADNKSAALYLGDCSTLLYVRSTATLNWTSEGYGVYFAGGNSKLPKVCIYGGGKISGELGGVYIGSEITSTSSFCVYAGSTIAVYGGLTSEATSLSNGGYTIYAGTYEYDLDSSYIASGYACELDTDTTSDTYGLYVINEVILAEVYNGSTLVGQYNSLSGAISAANAGYTVKLVKDINIVSSVSISKNITIDMNGFNITYSSTSSTNYAFNLNTSGSKNTLTLTNSQLTGGAITNASNYSNADCVALIFRGHLVIEDGVSLYSVNGFGIYLGGYTTAYNNGTIQATATINGGSIYGGVAGVVIYGDNKNTTSYGPILTVNGGEISGESYGIAGNGSSGYGPTFIYINGGTISGNTAIYHPQYGKIKITEADSSLPTIINGATAGVQMCSGDLTVSGGTITVSGGGDTSGKTGDGSIPDGAAVSAINRSYPGGAPSVTITGGTFVSANASAVAAYTWSGNSSSTWTEAPVTITGGKYSDNNAEEYVDTNTYIVMLLSDDNYLVTTASTGIASTIEVEFEKVSSNTYNINLVGKDSMVIYRFLASQLAFEVTPENGAAIGCTIAPADGISLTENNGVYAFNLTSGKADEIVNSGSNAGITNTSITIGTVTFTGIGTFEFSVKSADPDDTNKVQTAVYSSSDNNIVRTYVPASTTDTLAVDSGTGSITLSLDEVTLTINVVFPNSVDEQIADYNDMKINLSNVSGDSTIYLGSGTSNVTYDKAAIDGENYNAYIVTATVPKSYATTLEFVGAGYRTYRTSITPTDDAVVTVWNNAMDSEDTVVISADDNAMGIVKDDVTFLAGDIVANDVIDLWDLSAVVSYFGKKTDTTTVDEYAMYDLNRDGKIDSRDIAMVLVSWNK